MANRPRRSPGGHKLPDRGFSAPLATGSGFKVFLLWVRSISPRRSRGAGGLVVRESLGTTSQLGVSGAYQIDPEWGLPSPLAKGLGDASEKLNHRMREKSEHSF